MPHYCDTAPGHETHSVYHDTEYGFPVVDDNLLFERLVLEINQAGLSWATVLKKRQAFWSAFQGYDPRLVSSFGAEDKSRLLRNREIIRNKLKIDSVIYNASIICDFITKFGSFTGWLEHHHPLELDDWVALFKKNFKFTGKEITGEFLMSIGYLKGAHRETCPIFSEISRLKPPWMKA